jgi:hypothetical protein
MSILRILRNNRIGLGRGAAIAGAVGLGAVGVGSLISKLGSTAGTADPYRRTSINFPEDLLDNDHWIEFTAYETKGAATDSLGIAGLRGSEILGGTIRLPMPSSLSTDYNPTYAEESLGSIAGMALKPFDRAMYGNRDLGSEVSQGGAALAAATATSTLAGTAVQGVTSAVGGVVGADALNAALKVFGGVAVNPHKIVLFTGVGFRNHTFTWKLSPRNRNESNSIRLICEMFKFYSHPEYLAAGLFFKYPEFFRIKFRHPSYLFELEPSVCEDIRIDYHGQGFPAYIRDADGSGIPAPAEVSISLTFKETEIITKNTLTRGFRNNPSPAGVVPEGRNRDATSGATVQGSTTGTVGTSVQGPGQIGAF